MPERSVLELSPRAVLLRQFDMAWTLTEYHLTGLTTGECLWRPAGRGLHVVQQPDGGWCAEWPEHEGYGLGPASIAWVTWHIGFWWSMVLDHSFGRAKLTKDAVHWPGSAEHTCAWIRDLATQWRGTIDSMSDAEWSSTTRTRWPFTGRPFADVVAWVNTELTKNAAELGYARFLYGARD